jgi:hypothetical protein
MRERAYRLSELSRQVRRRTGKLIPLVRSASPMATKDVDRLVAYVAIEVLNTWSSFARAFFISSALGARTASGAYVTVQMRGLANPQDAIRVAMLKLKNKPIVGPVARRQEPSWHPVANLITLLSEIGASNLNTVAGALGFPTRAFEGLPTIRNFFAHRNGDTAIKCRNLCTSLSLPPMWRPADIVLQRDYTKPHNVITGWALDVATVVDLMVQ